MLKMLPRILGVSFIVLDKDKLLVIRRNPIHENDSGAIAIPGGHVEEGEKPEDTVKRELFEELELESSSYSFTL